MFAELDGGEAERENIIEWVEGRGKFGEVAIIVVCTKTGYYHTYEVKARSKRIVAAPGMAGSQNSPPNHRQKRF